MDARSLAPRRHGRALFCITGPACPCFRRLALFNVLALECTVYSLTPLLPYMYIEAHSIHVARYIHVGFDRL